MSLYDRILGHPFVYHHIRPMVVGIDYTAQYAALAATANDRILDVGCGGGDALRYLPEFASYHGFDPDDVAISFAKKRSESQRPNVHFSAAEVNAATVEDLRPTCVIMNGLLHHLDDHAAVDLVKVCGTAETVKRVVTSDPIYLRGKPLNNLLARMDRGKFVRRLPAYRELVASAGMTLLREDIVRSHPTRGIAHYLLMVLTHTAAGS